MVIHVVTSESILLPSLWTYHNIFSRGSNTDHLWATMFDGVHLLWGYRLVRSHYQELIRYHTNGRVKTDSPVPITFSARWQCSSPGSLHISTTSLHVVSGLIGISVTLSDLLLRCTLNIICNLTKANYAQVWVIGHIFTT